MLVSNERNLFRYAKGEVTSPLYYCALRFFILHFLLFIFFSVFCFLFFCFREFQFCPTKEKAPIYFCIPFMQHSMCVNASGFNAILLPTCNVVIIVICIKAAIPRRDIRENWLLLMNQSYLQITKRRIDCTITTVHCLIWILIIACSLARIQSSTRF